MISAKDARLKTDQYVSDKDQLERSSIQNAVDNAIKQNSYSIYVEKLSDTNQTWLENLGYNVTRYADPREQTIIVGWA